MPDSATPKPDPKLDNAALIAVDRACHEWRRGRPVAIRAGASRFLAMAVETLTESGFAALRASTGGVPLLALTARRAAILHLGPTGHDTILLPVTERMSVQVMRDLADPTHDLYHPMQGPFTRLKSSPPDAARGAIILAKRAQLLPAALLAELPDEAATTDILSVDFTALQDAASAAALSLQQVVAARLPLADAEHTRIVAFRPGDGSVEHLAIMVGDPARTDTHPEAAPVLVRLHSECFTGDLLGSLRCDCGEQLRGAIQAMAKAGAGIVLYLAQEGRGIGLMNKLRAYRLQDQGFDTIEANERLGFEGDERLFVPAAEMLRQLGFTRVRLMTNNPAKVAGLEAEGITVAERVSHAFAANDHNEAYLATKKKRSGHYL